jgi:hypothetical protein
MNPNVYPWCEPKHLGEPRLVARDRLQKSPQGHDSVAARYVGWAQELRFVFAKLVSQ